MILRSKRSLNIVSVCYDRPERARSLLVRRVSLVSLVALVPLESLVRLVSLVRLSELALPINQLASYVMEMWEVQDILELV